MRRTAHILVVTGLLAAVAVCVLAQQAAAQAGRGGAQPQGGRAAAPALKPPPLFFRETFKGTVAADPVNLTPGDALSPNLELRFYGPGAMAKPDHESGLHLYAQNDAVSGGLVTFVWSGATEANWALTIRDKNNYVDLSGPAKIRWRVRMRGLNVLRPVLKIADGPLLVGDFGEAESTYWRENEFYLVDVARWRVLDEKQIVVSTDSAWKIKPDLSKVDEIGFTDLARGAGHGTGGNSGVDWIEVYGNAVKR